MINQQENGRVIVTYGRSLIALIIAQSLGTRGIDVIGCDDVNLTVLSFSKYVSKNCLYRSWQDDEEGFIEDLIEIARENKPDNDAPYLLIPSFREAKILARYKDRFDGLITVACPDFSSIDQVDHKDRFAQTVEKYDVESPKTWLVENMEDLDQVIDEVKFPVFIKPPNEVGGRGISKVENRDELSSGLEVLFKDYADQKILIQTLSKGVDYCFCGLFDHGRLVASMVYHNVRKFPAETGQGVVRETVDDSRFNELAEQLMKPLKWHGVAGIDFMWDEENIPQMIEVNARFWAGLDHSVKSNVDFPYLLYRMFVDGEVEADDDVSIGQKTSLPGLATLARVETLFKDKFHFDRLEEQWPEIKKYVGERDLGKAKSVFMDALKDTISFSEAIETYKAITREAEEVEEISYADDDPLVGLGVLFILGSLFKHGKLPPELTH